MLCGVECRHFASTRRLSAERNTVKTVQRQTEVVQRGGCDIDDTACGRDNAAGWNLTEFGEIFAFDDASGPGLLAKPVGHLLTPRQGVATKMDESRRSL